MLDVALFAFIVAFLKEQFKLTGRVVIVVAVLIGSLFWFQPELTALSPVLGQVLEYLKFILAAPGLWDFTTNAGATIGKKVKQLPYG